MSDKSAAESRLDRWGDTWKPGKKERYGLWWAVRGLVGLPIGALAGLTAVIATGTRVPQAIGTAWRTICRERRIGPNLKAAMCIVTPFVMPVGAALISSASVLIGAARGFWQGPFHGPAEALADSYRGFQGLGEIVRFVWNEPAPGPLPEGATVYDIKPLLGVWSGVMGVVSGPALGAAHGWVYIRELPRLVHKVYSRLWGGRTGFVAFFLDVASVTVVPVAIVLGLPLFVCYGTLWGFGRGMRTTYKEGTGKVAGRLREAYAKSLRRWQESLGKTNHSKSDPNDGIVAEVINDSMEAVRAEG